MVGHLWLGPNSALSHVSAGALHGLWGFRRERPIHLSLIGAAPGRRDGRFVVHRRDERLRKEMVMVNNLPVASPRWTLLDLAAIRHSRLVQATDALIRWGKTSIDELWLMSMDPSVVRRHGRDRLVRVLEERTPQADLSDSGLELELDRLLRARGEVAILQHPIQLPSGIEVHPDLVFPEEMLAIEVDGREGHLERFDEDRARDRRLTALGWLVIRVTWAQLRYESEAVVDDILSALALRRRFVAPIQGFPG